MNVIPLKNLRPATPTILKPRNVDYGLLSTPTHQLDSSCPKSRKRFASAARVPLPSKPIDIAVLPTTASNIYKL